MTIFFTEDVMAVPTTFEVGSFLELKQIIEQGFSFPAQAIPFGEEDCARCRFFNSGDEVTESDFAALLADSYPMPTDGVSRVHFMSRPRTGKANFAPADSRFELFVT